MAVKQISVFLENRSGTLESITKLMSEGNIDIRAVTLADTARFGILRLIVSDPDRCQQLLQDGGFTVSITQVLAVGMRDTPGGLAEIIHLLTRNGISTEYVYAFVSHTSGTACVIMHTSDQEKAEQLLQEAGIPIFSQEQIYSV